MDSLRSWRDRRYSYLGRGVAKPCGELGRHIEIQSKITEAVFEVACVATLVPRSLLRNRSETLATQAIFEEMKVLVVDPS